MSPRERRSLLGGDIAMIFQDPDDEPEPVVQRRLPADGDVIARTKAVRAAARRARALELLERWAFPMRERRPSAFRTSFPAA